MKKVLMSGNIEFWEKRDFERWYIHLILSHAFHYILSLQSLFILEFLLFQEELDFIIEKLSKLEAPSLKGVAKASADGVYNRLTDHTKYTGSHKERFDAEGKGRGKLGREDIVEQTGYVAAYKNKDTYDKVHKNIQWSLTHKKITHKKTHFSWAFYQQPAE